MVHTTRILTFSEFIITRKYSVNTYCHNIVYLIAMVDM